MTAKRENDDKQTSLFHQNFARVSKRDNTDYLLLVTCSKLEVRYVLKQQGSIGRKPYVYAKKYAFRNGFDIINICLFRNELEASVMELGASGKRPASVVGLVDRRYDDVLKGVDTEDDAAARKSFIKWRRKEYRTVQNELIRRLDEALPQDSDRTMPEKFSAGSLALGKSGRTLHLVLEDTLRHMRQDASIVLATRLQSTTSQQAMQSGPSTPKAAVLTECNVGNDVNSLHRAALMNSVSLIVIELENPWCWTIRDVGLGARRFFRDAPFSSIVGHSLAHLMRCEDMPVRWNETALSRTLFNPHSEMISH